MLCKEYLDLLYSPKRYLFFLQRDVGNEEAMMRQIAEQRMPQVKIQNQTFKIYVDKSVLPHYLCLDNNVKSYSIGKICSQASYVLW